jgi:hypothetical protein
MSWNVSKQRRLALEALQISFMLFFHHHIHDPCIARLGDVYFDTGKNLYPL